MMRPSRPWKPMTRRVRVRCAALAAILAAGAGVALIAQKDPAALPPVTSEMLENPSPEDWLMYSRTYDAQRFSPLEFINRRNVSQLKTAWTRPMANGTHEGIPLVYQGVMYVIQPGATVWALDDKWRKRTGGGTPTHSDAATARTHQPARQVFPRL